MKRFFYHSMIAFVVVGMTLSCSPSKTLGPQTLLQLADNPFITHMYTADPSAHVWEDGRIYVYASHDIDPPAGCDRMDRYHVFSTDDMVNWTDHGEILNSGDVAWGRTEGGFMCLQEWQVLFLFPPPFRIRLEQHLARRHCSQRQACIRFQSTRQTNDYDRNGR